MQWIEDAANEISEKTSVNGWQQTATSCSMVQQQPAGQSGMLTP